MEIEQHIWGMTPDGEAVILYTMRNAAGAEVQISTYGAAVVAIKVPDREGRMADVALGYKHFNSYFGDPASCGKILGRCAGPLAYGMAEIDGTEHRLEINDGMHHRNGGSKGFANRLWEGRVETNRIVLSLTSEDGDAGYPGEVDVEVLFDFDDNNTLEITCLARTDRVTSVDLASRIYLNLAGEDSGPISGHELQINASQALEYDDEGIPTGRLLDVADTLLDFRTARPLDPTAEGLRRYGCAFPIDGYRPHILTEAAELRHPASGRRMTLLTSQPCLVADTAGRIAGGCPETKSGGRYAPHAGVALVCQHHPDALHYAAFPSPLLHPGELYCQKTVCRFGITEG